jgi:hypothetical protein
MARAGCYLDPRPEGETALPVIANDSAAALPRAIGAYLLGNRVALGVDNGLSSMCVRKFAKGPQARLHGDDIARVANDLAGAGHKLPMLAGRAPLGQLKQPRRPLLLTAQLL